MSILPTFSQTRLRSLTARLKVMMYNIEVLKRWKLIVTWQWSRYEKFEFTRCAQQAIASVDAQLLADAFNHTIDFGFKIC